MIESDMVYATHDTIEMIGDDEEGEEDDDIVGDLERMLSKTKSINKSLRFVPNMQLKYQFKSEDLYAPKTEVTSTTTGMDDMYSSTTTTTGGMEGINKYSNIVNILQAVEPDEYTQYLENFKREKVDDQRLQKYKVRFSRHHQIWKQLIPAFGTRQDFLDCLYANWHD